MRFLLTEKNQDPGGSLKIPDWKSRSDQSSRCDWSKDAKSGVNGPVSYHIEQGSLQRVRPVATQGDADLG